MANTDGNGNSRDEFLHFENSMDGVYNLLMNNMLKEAIFILILLSIMFSIY